MNKKEQIDEFFNRYIEAVFPSREKAIEMLANDQSLTLYFGIDPTGPDLHLGHTIGLLALKKMQQLGHKIVLLIGDFTAMIGDPTGKDMAPKPLSQVEIKANMKTYLKQASMILSKNTVEVRYNSKWLKRMSFEDVVKISSHFTVQQMIVRDMFQKRIKDEKPIGLHEFLYPLMQGYDSVAMQVDGEIGGNDQTFNMLIGRDLCREILNKEKLVIATKLLEDPVSGKKLMSKSEGGYVSLQDSPENMFGKIMAMPDSAIIPLLRYTTEISDEEIDKAQESLDKGENPKDVKKYTARALVQMYHGEKKAQKAEKNFEKIFSRRELPEEIQEFSLTGADVSVLTLLVEWLGVSKTEAKNLITQRAVRINEQPAEDWNSEVKVGDVVKVGPRRFVKIV